MQKYVDNILRVYNLSTEADREEGHNWYTLAHQFALETGERYDIPVERVCGVISALSPRNKWHRNLTDARNICSAFYQGIPLDQVKVSTFHSNRDKCQPILEGKPIDQIIKGPKTWAFYNNILDPSGPHITIDFHAANICDWEHRSHSIRGAKYLRYQSYYLEAAKILSIHPSTLQAITWTTWRRERDSLLKQEICYAE